MLAGRRHELLGRRATSPHERVPEHDEVDERELVGEVEERLHRRCHPNASPAHDPLTRLGAVRRDPDAARPVAGAGDVDVGMMRHHGAPEERRGVV